VRNLPAVCPSMTPSYAAPNQGDSLGGELVFNGGSPHDRFARLDQGRMFPSFLLWCFSHLHSLEGGCFWAYLPERARLCGPSGISDGIRTRVHAVKGRCPNHWTTET
jgi:hypothetical protein